MKKTFRSILAGAVALLAVSCYDDSALRKQNELLKDQLNDLKESLVDASEFGIDRDELFLMYSAEKSLNLIAEGVAEYSVMNEPDGWQATIEGTTLKIVAPAKEAYEHGAAALKGEISIHATSNTGACKIAKIAVESGPGVRFTIEGDNVIIRNAMTTSASGNVEFASFAMGMMEADQWLNFPSMMDGKSFEDCWKEEGTPMGKCVTDFYGMAYEYVEKGVYVEGENEVDVITVSVADLWSIFGSWRPLEYGVYTMWAAGLNAEYLPAAGIETAIYKYVKYDVQLGTVSHDDVQIIADVAGATEYLVGCVSEYGYAGLAVPSFAGYMKELWPVFKSGGYMQIGEMFDGWQVTNENGGGVAYNVSELIGKLVPGTKYHLWIMPIYAYKNVVEEMDGNVLTTYPNYDYDEDFLPYVFEFTTAELAAGGPETVIAAGPTMMDAVSAQITLTEGQSAHYAFFSATEYAELAGEEAIIKAIEDKIENDILAQLPFPILTSTGIVAKNYLAGDTEKYVCAAYTVSADGKRGDITVLNDLAVGSGLSSDITITLTSFKEDGDDYVAEFDVTGASDVYWRNLTADESNTSKHDGYMASLSPMLNYYCTSATVQDGKLTITFAKNSYKKDLYVYAYNSTTSSNLIDMMTDKPVTLVTSFNRTIVNIATELAK